MSAELTVLATATPARIDDVTSGLRILVESADRARRAGADDAGDGRGRRTWAVIGELLVEGPDSDDENHRAVEHDRVGRLAVRLAVDKVLCVGSGRVVRALHQGTVMEGSWGDEVRQVQSVEEVVDLFADEPQWRPQPGDTVLWAVSEAPASGITAFIQDAFHHPVSLRTVEAEKTAQADKTAQTETEQTENTDQAGRAEQPDTPDAGVNE
ncbi:UDP-N-acetylmuramoyl-tripeptide--D-alanyl-D-alanine ligase [Gordonia polyisoprenivorans]|uniref:UDP-N-acetylmuramoyl-tripeptide--D-alanyl-D- alanine ligase n=1 Tax=Gordonia polyisoprenivorans TaxID=84595 RepID=UPI001AD79F05|nr:UDP-N-acetylmuramoyl-tripeptide--D-alanyl-D-alanine ligase [Gordonia polyisoprenivorans]QTI67567.1 UDP-N-acetylmuramoyl-tripeptide--D-alanyl-D-alanine ligase [Gordonia polyisoprenivorans]